MIDPESGRRWTTAFGIDVMEAATNRGALRDPRLRICHRFAVFSAAADSLCLPMAQE